MLARLLWLGTFYLLTLTNLVLVSAICQVVAKGTHSRSVTKPAHKVQSLKWFTGNAGGNVILRYMLLQPLYWLMNKRPKEYMIQCEWAAVLCYLHINTYPRRI